jgi:hypothetical protein
MNPSPLYTHSLPFISGPDEISNEDYHRGEAYKEFVSSSNLKNYLISPKYARYTQLHPKTEQTKAMEEGSVYHDYLASLVNCKNLSAFPWIAFDKPPVNTRTGKPFGKDSQAYIDAENEFLSDNPNKKVCDASTIRMV